MNPNLKIRRLPHAAHLPLPNYQSIGAAGMDICAAVKESVFLAPRERCAVPTGFILEIPQGFEGQIRPRSGLALNHGITCLNSPGTIDSDYRGEIKVILINLGNEPFEITYGMRISQLVIAPVSRLQIQEVQEMTLTLRGAGGFGSTGL
jgi:dUTP pyrophosphatase